MAPSEPASEDATNDLAPSAFHEDLFHAALALPGLTPTQTSQIQALIQQKETINSNIRTARGQLLDALAGQLASGNVNAAALAPKVQAVVAAIQADEPANRALLENLHAILSPSQRAGLVSDVESRMQAQMAQSPSGGSGGNGSELGWVSKLNLSPAQQSQIEMNVRTYYASIPPNARANAWEEHMRMLDAFQGATFVMNEVVPMKSRDEIERRVNRTVSLAQAAAPVLTPDQRASAASMLQSWASTGEK